MKEEDIDNVLVLDIETDGKDPETSQCIIWGCYSFADNRYYSGTGGSRLQKLINRHKFIVGHNIDFFDMPIIERQYGIERHPELRTIDTMLLLVEENMNFKSKQRYKIISELRIVGLNDNRLPGSGLEDVMLHFNKVFKDSKFEKYFKDFKQDDFDYEVLKKKEFTQEDWDYIEKYLKQDVMVTKNLYLFFEDYFDDFRNYLSPKDNFEKIYINSTPGAMGYKILCHLAGVEPTYAEEYEKAKYDGGFVALPTQDSAKGYIYAIDLNSAYPHAFMMYNLYTPTRLCRHKVNGECPNPLNGQGIFKDLQGTYCGCEMGKFEKVIYDLYQKRLEYKRNKDPREYAIKIVINLIYGLSGSPLFTRVYDMTTASDCTYIVRETIKYCRKRFADLGYHVLYTDTDSVYIKDPFENYEKVLTAMKVIEEEIKNDTPYPMDTFGLGFDDKIKAMFFFRREDNPRFFKKKHYIYITQDDKLKLKGLPVIKRNASPLAKKIVKEKLKPKIIETRDIKFDKSEIEKYIKEYIEKDISLLAVKFRIKNKSYYKNPSCLAVRIGERYGTGKKEMIRNKAGVGVGVSRSYCSIEEAKNLKYRHLDLEVVWKELAPFVKKENQLRL